MKTILSMAKPLDGLLGAQRLKEGEPCRLMRYVVQQPVEGGLLLYHVLTKAVVLLDEDEAHRLSADPASVPGLVEGWFAVPLSHDDRELALQVRAVGKMLEKPVRRVRSFTILTTTDCNARCFYCYEKGRSRIPMRDETAVEVARYIVRNAAGESVRIRWFGGEPLYNKGVITRICRLLQDAGVGYKSEMVSNGYLFDEKTVEEAVSLWNLAKVQITLDGTESVYNRAKAFIYPEGSAFRRVIGNMHLLVGAGIRVTVRLNVDRHNAEDLFSLADQLGAEFGGEPLLNVYSHPLFESCSVEAAVHHTDLERKALYDSRMRLQQKLQEANLFRQGKFRHSLKLNRCMADNDGAVVILPDGHVGKCEHYTDSGWFGHVSEEDWDEAVRVSYKELREELDACRDCAFYPDCIRPVKCEESVHCYPEEREEKLAEIRTQLLSYYRSHEVSD